MNKKDEDIKIAEDMKKELISLAMDIENSELPQDVKKDLLNRMIQAAEKSLNEKSI